ncbi:MAG TPA: LysM domain-containing protein [Candidatus Limnocylindrales bacterium]
MDPEIESQDGRDGRDEPDPGVERHERHEREERRATDTAPFHVPGMAATMVIDEAAETAPEPETDLDDEDVITTEDVVARPTWLALLDDRSPDPDICPFLRSIGERGLTAPIEAPDAGNRCAALAEAVPQSRRQQELVCLTTGHVNCPRYLRGAAVMTDTPAVAVREGRAMSPAMLGSLVVLVMALTASVAFVLARGGALGIGPTGPSASAPVAVVSPSPSVAPPSPTAAAVASPTPTASPSPSPTPIPSPSPTATIEPTPPPTQRPAPTSDRYQLLRACPNTPRCFIYTVRSGDNVFSIARYFGVPMDSIYDRNPWLRETGLRAGQQLRLPPPTR